jgi:hypothetical protein
VVWYRIGELDESGKCCGENLYVPVLIVVILASKQTISAIFQPKFRAIFAKRKPSKKAPSKKNNMVFNYRKLGCNTTA